MFFIPEHATLVTGDILSGTGGVLHVFVDEADPERLLPALDALAELPIERVIIPHGDAILADGAARIRRPLPRPPVDRYGFGCQAGSEWKRSGSSVRGLLADPSRWTSMTSPRSAIA